MTREQGLKIYVYVCVFFPHNHHLKKRVAVGRCFNSKPAKGAEAELVSDRQHPLRHRKQQIRFYFSFRSFTVLPLCLKRGHVLKNRLY